MEIKSVIDCVININRVLSRTDAASKGGLTLKMQVLLAIKKYGGEITVKQIFDNVKIVKSNLALLCNKMCESGVIEKIKAGKDGRQIKYKLLEKGENEVNEFLKKSESSFTKILSGAEQDKLEQAAKTINDILN